MIYFLLAFAWSENERRKIGKGLEKMLEPMAFSFQAALETVRLSLSDYIDSGFNPPKGSEEPERNYGVFRLLPCLLPVNQRLVIYHSDEDNVTLVLVPSTEAGSVNLPAIKDCLKCWFGDLCHEHYFSHDDGFPISSVVMMWCGSKDKSRWAEMELKCRRAAQLASGAK